MADESQDVPGHVEPDPGTDSPPESDIPVGVDALTDDQIAQAEEAGPVAGSGEEGGDDGALDVSALMDDSGDDGDADDAGDGGDDAGDADATPDDDVEGPDAATEEG